MMHLVVDAANVVGSRPDGWWRDRAGAARRLAGSIVAVLVSRPEDLLELLDGTTPDSAETAGSDLAVAAVQVHLVLEGAARAVEDLPTHPLLDVVHAPADGDSAIVDLVGELVGGPGRVLVVTADRALRARVHAAGAEVTGPGTFRAALPEHADLGGAGGYQRCAADRSGVRGPGPGARTGAVVGWSRRRSS